MLKKLTLHSLSSGSASSLCILNRGWLGIRFDLSLLKVILVPGQSNTVDNSVLHLDPSEKEGIWTYKYLFFQININKKIRTLPPVTQEHNEQDVGNSGAAHFLESGLKS